MDADQRIAPPHLGEFLRARRALVSPESHGLPTGERRTPGLRREEVAVLVGVSTDYYVRLEQGRDRRPSPRVVDALAAALLLDAATSAYLRTLAFPLAPGRPAPGLERAASGLMALLDAWSETPALVYGRYLDLLAANALGTALFDWIGDETNLLRAIFTDPAAPAFYRDWAVIAEGCVAGLRAECTDPDDPHLVELVGELSVASPEFARFWARHEVRAKTATRKHLRHRVVGELALRFENLTVADAPGQHLVVYHAEPGSPEVEALALLGRRTEPS